MAHYIILIRSEVSDTKFDVYGIEAAFAKYYDLRKSIDHLVPTIWVELVDGETGDTIDSNYY